MAYLKVSNLTIGYEGMAVAEHISVEVNPGDYVCIVGENGAGKSTLMKTILHLQKPMAGEISYEEYGIGYLPQQTVVQKDFPASVWEIVLSGNLAKSGLRPFYSKTERSLAKKNMENMEIWDLRKQCYRNLSGGQQQRVLLARALCASSIMLFLDEPVAGLDPIVTAQFYHLLEKINRDGMTILMVSHDLKMAMQYATHILHIGKEDVFFGTKEEYGNSDVARDFHELEERGMTDAGSDG